MSISGLAETKLRSDAIGVWHIVFFVVAAAAPLAVVVGVTPYAFAFGNGTGVPLTFMLVGLMYVVFSIGFSKMSAHIGRAISFYPYIAAALVMVALDPVAIVGWASGFTAIGILMIQILVSLSVIVYFNADHRGSSLWQRAMAPGISVILLSACLYLMVINIEFVSGSASPIVRSFPLVIAALILLGIAFARWLKTARPGIYANLGKILN